MQFETIFAVSRCTREGYEGGVLRAWSLNRDTGPVRLVTLATHVKLTLDGQTMTSQESAPSSHRVLSYADSAAVFWQDFWLLVGRVMVGWIYLQSGWGKLFNIAGVGKTFPQRGLPEWMAYISVPTEFFGGLFLLLGFATRYTALVMLIFTIVATLSSHAYWSSPDAQRVNQETHFWKNVSIMGGIIILFVSTAGRFSFDSWLRTRR